MPGLTRIGDFDQRSGEQFVQHPSHKHTQHHSAGEQATSTETTFRLRPLTVWLPRRAGGLLHLWHGEPTTRVSGAVTGKLTSPGRLGNTKLLSTFSLCSRHSEHRCLASPRRFGTDPTKHARLRRPLCHSGYQQFRVADFRTDGRVTHIHLWSLCRFESAGSRSLVSCQCEICC
jgi:hypothetical protein